MKENSENELERKIDLIKEFMGEHCDSWVIIANIKHDEDEGGGSTTISSWDAEFNEAVGMVERMKERLRQKMLETDFPDNPSGEDWKEVSD